MRVGAVPRAVPRAGRLAAANVDAPAGFRRWLAARRRTLATIALRGTYLDSDDVDRLLRLSLPGIDEVMALIEIRRLAAGYDRVIVDTAPTGHTLRLLGAPAMLEQVASVLDLLQEHHRDVVSALRGTYRSDSADRLIQELDDEGRTLAAALRDPALTTIAWVTLPEPMALEETADALDALRRAGIGVHRLIVNRITPPPLRRCAWCDARRRVEARAVAPIARRFADVAISAVPSFPREPIGVAALRHVANALSPWQPGARPIAPPRHRVVATTPGGAAVLPRTLAEGARWLLVGGKGGAGKSTCAASIAIDAARAHPSARVLLLSSDPAHSLGDVFGEPFDDHPRSPAEGPANLVVREIDAASGLAQFRDRYVASVDAAFDRITRAAFGASGDAQAFHRLIDLAPPGIDEVIAIADVASALAARPPAFDLIVSDTAPTGHALRLLQTPAILREWVQALMTLLLKYREIVAAGSLGGLLVELSKRLRGLEQWLTDHGRTRFVVVTRGDAMSRAESVRLMKTLRTLDVRASAVIVNAAGAGACGRCRRIRAAQTAEVARLRRDLGRRGHYAIIETPAEAPPPHGVAALAAWSRRWRRID